MAERAQTPKNEVAVGGQAVVEGVMMRAPGATSVAVRKPDGSLVVRVRAARRLAMQYPWLGKPAMRGVAVLLETLFAGMSALNFSAEQAMPPGEAGKGKPGGAASSAAIVATLAVSLAFGFTLFAVVPHAITWAIGWAGGSEALEGGRAVVFHLVDGAVKMLIFLGFVWGMSKVKDMRRVFEYHGAEHQAVHAFEAGLAPTAEDLGRFPTAHARCGTAFMVTVIAVSILVFAGVFPLLPVLSDRVWLNQAAYVLIKAPLVLPIAGLSYEVIRAANKARGKWAGRIVSAPGVWFQRITTQPPDRSQQEVAVVAIACATSPGRAGVGDAQPEALLTFPDYAAFETWRSLGA